MKNNNFANHISKYFNRYIYSLIVIIIIIVFLSRFIPDYAEEKKEEDYSSLKEDVVVAYKIDPNILVFDAEGIAILQMDILYAGVSNKKESFIIPPKYDANFDQCVGYLIIKKIGSDLDIDTSHMCEMIDY